MVQEDAPPEVITPHFDGVLKHLPQRRRATGPPADPTAADLSSPDLGTGHDPGHTSRASRRANHPICTCAWPPRYPPIGVHIGYLEPSLSTPSLTRTSAAWTCSRTSFTQ